MRVFLLGPSHHKYLTGCALSNFTRYATPLGYLPLDLATIAELRATGAFENMSSTTDEDEHSLEMHLPYIRHSLSNTTESSSAHLVPILVGSTNPDTDKAYGAILAPYLSDPANVFVISSDFCHWGPRFSYTYYLPAGTGAGRKLGSHEAPTNPPIHESIRRIDQWSMDAIETGSHNSFLNNLASTKNTVCGRHPIGVIMAAIEVLKQEGKLAQDKGLFRFVRYERSNNVTHAKDGSVSYASAFAIL